MDQGSGSPIIPYGLNLVRLSFMASNIALFKMCRLSWPMEADSADIAENAELFELYALWRASCLSCGMFI